MLKYKVILKASPMAYLPTRYIVQKRVTCFCFWWYVDHSSHVTRNEAWTMIDNLKLIDKVKSSE